MIFHNVDILLLFLLFRVFVPEYVCLIACANVISNVNSYFIWKNKVQNSKEIIICGKTTSKNQKKIIQIVKSLQSYSVPCIIFFDIKAGNKDFLKWIKRSVT